MLKHISILTALLMLFSIFPLWAAPAISGFNADSFDISCGWGHSVLMKNDGTVWCWGYNETGQLGDGTNGDFNWDTNDSYRTRPFKVFDKAVDIATTYNTSFALTDKGELYDWGWNYGGRLGTGKDDYCVPYPSKIIDDVASIVEGKSNHSAVIRKDGSLWIWGGNWDGQLADGTKTNRPKPFKKMDGVKTAAIGETHTLVVKKDGSLWGWGQNWEGQLGTGDGKYRGTPVKILTNIRKAACGSNQSAAVSNDNSLWIWSKDLTGSFGKPKVCMKGVQDVALGINFVAALKTDGTLWTWGDNHCGQLGDGTKVFKGEPKKIMSNVAKIAAGNEFVLAITKDGKLWGFGDNSYGQLGLGDNVNRSKPTLIMDLTQKSLTVQLNGKNLTFDMEPQLAKGQVLVPLQKMYEYMGAQVEYNTNTKTYNVARGDRRAALTVGQNKASINGTARVLAVPVTVIDKRLMAPLGFIAESMGAKLTLTGSTASVEDSFVLAAVSIDGMLEDWADIKPLAVDETGDAPEDVGDLQSLYAFRDSGYLYVAIKTGGNEPVVDINLDVNADGANDYILICFSNDSRYDLFKLSPEGKAVAVMSSPLAFKDAFELRVSLKDIGEPGQIRINASVARKKDGSGYKSPAYDEMPGWFDVAGQVH